MLGDTRCKKRMRKIYFVGWIGRIDFSASIMSSKETNQLIAFTRYVVLVLNKGGNLKKGDMNTDTSVDCPLTYSTY